ncbi:MAG: quinone oxidoreductase [Anaerolineaceae bacterium]|nr:quinone oxidoreductase [Anaerolineaceae bacterium]
MKAIQVHQTGGPDVMRYEDIAIPQPGQGQARVKIEAAGLNYIDIYHRIGQYPLPLPFTPGMEGAGVVDAVGEGVTEVQPGDRVAYTMERGAYAEYAIVPAWKLVPLPDAVSAQQAAVVMLQGLTAHYLSHSTYPVQPGDTALVHAAAGGVGLLLVQMVKRRGGRVIGTVSSEEKAELAHKAGADEVILYTKQDFETETRRLTDGKGVEVVYDSVGLTTFDKSLKCLKPRGYLVLYGAASGPVPPFDLQRLNAGGSLFITRPSLGHYTATREETLGRANEVFGWIAAGELDVRIDRTFHLADAPVAHRYMEARQTKGKVLLLP